MKKLVEVPQSLYPSHSWLKDNDNRAALRDFLAAYDLNIGVVQTLTFHLESFEAVCYVRDSEGHFVLDGEHPTLQVVTKPYLPNTKPKLLRQGRARSG